MTNENESNEDITPNPELADLQAQLTSLQNKQSEILNEQVRLKQIAREVDSLGGLDTIKGMVETAPIVTKETESVIKQKDDHIHTLEDRLNAFEQRIMDKEFSTQLRDSLSKAGVDGRSLDNITSVIKPHIKTRVNASMVDGNTQLNIVGRDNNPMLVDGRDAELGDLVKELATDPVFEDFFKKNFKGSGAQPGSATQTTTNNPFLKETEDVVKQRELYMSNPDKAARLAKEADDAIGYRPFLST